MRRKAAPTKASARENATIRLLFGGENPHFRLIKPTGKTYKTPTGKGLGKAGARRLGRMLKRAIQDQEDTTGKGKIILPKTPVRLFKHKIQTNAGDAPMADTAKLVTAPVSQLILSVVSQCKHKGGISMAELKQTLAAGGYDVSKNNKRVNVVTNRLVNNETLVRTTRSTTYKLNNKKLPDTTQVKTIPVKPPKPKRKLKHSTGPRKSPRLVKSQRPVTKNRKPRSKSHTPKGKTRKVVAKSHRPIGKTRKPAIKSHKQRRTTPKKRRKSPKPAGARRRSSTNRTTRVRKAPRKTLRTRKQRAQRVRRPHKSYRRRQRPKRRLPKTRSLKHREAKRISSYYYY
ncbi:histone H1-like isoform X1 [Mugil cephalus]|uniref:histone H1-like isoform X1 n=2 Tax=Mugil cephalus TaxID=48193 RepID=UPI001FB56F10|nr:histone H1-like isoform X1 [Mugil cephalus]